MAVLVNQQESLIGAEDATKQTNAYILCEQIKNLLQQADEDYNMSEIDVRYFSNSSTEATITMFDKSCFSVKGKKTVYLYIAPAFQKDFDSLDLQRMATTPWKRIELNKVDMSQFQEALVEVYKKCWLASSEQFGCCSRYLQCSDNLKCVQPDLELKGGCQYRQNLRHDRIFYGKNKNI